MEPNHVPLVPGCLVPLRDICPLLKQWRQVAKGKATLGSARLGEAMVEYRVPEGGRVVVLTRDELVASSTQAAAVQSPNLDKTHYSKG